MRTQEEQVISHLILYIRHEIAFYSGLGFLEVLDRTVEYSSLHPFIVKASFIGRYSGGLTG